MMTNICNEEVNAWQREKDLKTKERKYEKKRNNENKGNNNKKNSQTIDGKMHTTPFAYITNKIK